MRHERNYRELIAAKVQRRLKANIERAKAMEEASRLIALPEPPTTAAGHSPEAPGPDDTKESP